MKLLERSAHPNIIRFYEVLHARSYVLFRMEDGGPLNLNRRLGLRDRKRKTLDVQKVEVIFGQMAAGVFHMHALSIAHRDIKPENTIVAEAGGQIMVKIADFDTARVIQRKGLLRGISGTFPFMAPEMYLKQQYDAFPADVWSMAVLFVEVFCGLDTLQNALGLQPYHEDPSYAERFQMQCSSLKEIHMCFARSGSAALLLRGHIKPELSKCLADARVFMEGMFTFTTEQRWSAQDVHSRFDLS